MLGPTISRAQLLQKPLYRSSSQLWRLRERAPFGDDSPNSSMCLVAVRVAKARLIMPDDRIKPVTNVERAVGPEFRVHRAKVGTAGFQQRREILQSESGTVVMDL